VAQIMASIKEFGFTNPILTDGENGIIAGHGRVMAAQRMGLDEVPTIELSHLTEAQRKAYIIADNKLALNSGWDEEMLKIELSELEDLGFDMDLTGFEKFEIDELFGDEDINLDIDEVDQKDIVEKVSLIDKFGIAPFSIFDTRKANWMDRKKVWKNAIQDNGETRENTLYKSSGDPVSDKLQEGGGVSILDPVMAEIVTAWFGKKDGTVFDPFAGDSVFGFVSATLGMNFVGIELREEQAKLNQARCDEYQLSAKYINDTSEKMDLYLEDKSVDMIFSCPPYADLEVYSDNPLDLSTMSHDDFFAMYKKILQNTFAKLKDNRFAVIVMGEVRNKKGNYIGTIPNTIKIMEEAGYFYYNEIILVNSTGNLALRAGRQMEATRKIGKHHQNILVFLKGDAKKAVYDLGDIQIDFKYDEEENNEG
jgi:DNA modification methylase